MRLAHLRVPDGAKFLIARRFASCSEQSLEWGRIMHMLSAHAVEVMLFLTVVTRLALRTTLPYAMSGSLVPAIEHLDWRSRFLTVGRCFPEKWLRLQLVIVVFRRHYLLPLSR